MAGGHGLKAYSGQPKYMSNDVKEVLQFLEKVKSDLSKFQKAPSSKDKGKKKIEEDLKKKVIEADKREPPKTKTAIGRPTKDTVIDGIPFGTLKDPVRKTVDKDSLLKYGRYNVPVKSYSINGGQVYPYLK